MLDYWRAFYLISLIELIPSSSSGATCPSVCISLKSAPTTVLQKLGRFMECPRVRVDEVATQADRTQALMGNALLVLVAASLLRRRLTNSKGT